MLQFSLHPVTYFVAAENFAIAGAFTPFTGFDAMPIIDPEVWDIVAQAFENKPEAANTFAQLLFDIKRAIADGSRNQLLFSMGFKTVPLPAIV